jgi:hypothetical protein
MVREKKLISDKMLMSFSLSEGMMACKTGLVTCLQECYLEVEEIESDREVEIESEREIHSNKEGNQNEISKHISCIMF